jgi:hypothetical protein
MPHGDGRLPGDTESVARAGGLSIKQDHELPVRTRDSVPGQTVEAIGGGEWTGRESSCNLLIQHECFSPQSGENALGNQCGPAAFDSAIPWFESRRPSQILSHKISWLGLIAGRLSSVFMLRHVAEISMHFQRSPFVVGSSTRHKRNMERNIAPRRITRSFIARCSA